MKNLLFVAIAVCTLNGLYAQNIWTQLNDASFTGRMFAVTFALDTDGDNVNDKGFYGTGYNGGSIGYVDFWEYDPATDSWTQKADVPGPTRREASGFGIGSKGYIGAGATGFPGTFLNDFYAYDHGTNTWDTINDLPGLTRWGALSFTMNGKGYYGFGSNGSVSSPAYLNDFWEYDPAQDSWTALASCACTGRYEAEGFAIDIDQDGSDDKAYVFNGHVPSGRSAEMWEYDRALDQWSQKTDVPGVVRDAPTAFTINGKGYVGLGRTDGAVLQNDLHEYDPATDTWIAMADFSGTSRVAANEFVIGNGVYVVGGFDGNALSEVYHYSPFLNGYSTIRGNVFADFNTNCSVDSADFALTGWLLKADPGPYYGSTDSVGNYAIMVAPGTYNVSLLNTALQASLSNVACPASGSWPVQISTPGIDTSGFDFANEVLPCPLLDVTVASSGRRRCFENITVINYCNTGFVAAANVEVFLDLPEQVLFIDADHAWSYDADSNIVFAVGALPAGECGEIYVVDQVRCDNVEDLGLTVCTEVWITPVNNCIPVDTQWNEAHLQAGAVCLDGTDTVVISVTNTGLADMTDSVEYRVYFDQTLVFTGNILLPQGGVFSLLVPSNGQTIRIEADQPAFDPLPNMAIAWNEGCGIDIPMDVSMGFVMLFPLGDEAPENDINCMTIIGSWDPNDKQVSPVGLTDDHYTLPGTTLDYQIRFQNTGTDTAFNIVVRDTLSDHLDPSTIKITGASHAYTYEITGLNKPELKFTFSNILLPDSNVNLLGSQGFVTFTAQPYANTPLETVIENTADIYFDFNPAVRTNTVFNTISNYREEDLSGRVEGGVLVYTGIGEMVKTPLVNVYPNPGTGQFYINLNNVPAGQLALTLTDLTGREIKQQTVLVDGVNNIIPFNTGKLPSGLYLLTLQGTSTFMSTKLIIEK